MDPSPPIKIRLLIVDDHAVVREGLQAMLATDPRIADILTAEDGATALRCCASFQPHLVLLDQRMPGGDGLGVLEDIRRQWPEIRVIMLSASATAPEVALARRHGAAGFLTKSASLHVLLEALFSVMDGGRFVEPVAPPITGPVPQLTPRELEVLQHLGRGLGNVEVGTALGVSGETIKSHLKAIFTKLGVAGRAEAVAQAYQLGLFGDKV